MNTANDLMGFGLPPLLASRLSDSGIGVINPVATGTTATGGFKIVGSQYTTAFTTAGSQQAAVLPAVGGDAGALIGDDFTISNVSSTALLVFTPTNVTLNVAGAQVTNTSAITVAQFHTLSAWAISSILYVGSYS